MIVLCLNSGSSSLKVAIFDGERPLARFEHRADFRALFERIGAEFPRVDAVGHRVVHGGPSHHAPERITPELIASLRSVTPFAPLHLPASLAGIEAVRAWRPKLPQVVCFDTAFHWNLPEVARRFPLPESFLESGIRRYGFHGLSYEYVVSRLELPSRTILAHLGNGASMVALRDGRPIDTTMGLTPAGGFMMGTRTGDLDPGVLIFLARRGVSADDLERVVDRESGLLGVSAKTSDMRALLAARATDPRARLAVEMFCYQCRKSVGALAGALGGLDALVFTGGIGEHAPPVRAGICARLEHLGIRLDEERNTSNAEVISSGRCTVRVIATDEDLMIARHTATLLAS